MAVAPLVPAPPIDLAAYYEMVARGELEDSSVELLEGELVDVSPPSPAHAAVVDRLTRYLGEPKGCWLRVQSPLEVPPASAPEPDLALLGEEPSTTHHPRKALLAIEVAIHSYPQDRNRKWKLYAQAEIPTYWLVNLLTRTVERHTDPEPRGYRSGVAYREHENVPAPLDGLPDLSVAALLRGVDVATDR